MITSTLNWVNRESVRSTGLVWLRSFAVLSLGALIFRMGAQIDWHNLVGWFHATITYAIVYLSNSTMALVFLGSTMACLAALTITFFKHRKYNAKLANILSAS